MKRTSLLAALLVVVGLVAGCGSSDSSTASGDSGGSASVEEFCGAFLDLIEQARQQGTDISDADAVELAKDFADKLEEMGAPSDMPADARRALETAIEKIKSLPDDATQEDMSKAAEDLTEDQQKDQEALSTYISTKCLDALSSPSPSSS